MSFGNEENVARSLKRPYPVNNNAEVAAEDAGYSLGGGGGKEDMSQETLTKLEKEVSELAGKVAECREKGPVAFASLLDRSLAQMRSSSVLMDTQVSNKPANGMTENEDDVASTNKEKMAQRTKLLERLASAKESLPVILSDMKACKERLDKAMIAHRQRPAKDLPLNIAPDRDVMELLSLPDK